MIQKQYGTSRSHLKTFQRLARMRKNDETLNTGLITIGQLIDSGFTIVRHPDEQNSTTGKVSTLFSLHQL
ncbi:unnamed protein product [Gongylonema pulchrum]|uniref:Transcriptional regulator n=1 Tax=Gongylonema pulchrum TaxID=637853 RepID=A0A183DIE9_9BILA|nr:unnamed protein product [Gongylonema pulchrum]